MATPLAFVPRAVAKHAKPWQGISRPPSPPPDPTTDDDSEPEKEKTVANSKRSQDIASLVSLALSDYNIWLDADLRWKLDACSSGEEEAGFVPINYILRRAPFRGSLPQGSGEPEPSETEVVKALRTHASRTLEVQMRLPSSSAASSVWYGTGKTSRKKDVGGYQVRRRDWQMLRHRPSRGWARARWDDLTAYMEGIPPQYRTVGGITRFADALLLSSGTDVEPSIHIQNISLPPHYLDKPGDAPKCKGYALVTFGVESHLEAVIRAWPWKRRREPDSPHKDRDGDEAVSSAVKEAHKYGLRTISKARWDALNEEYLQYKQHLVDEMALAQIGMSQTMAQIERPKAADVDAQKTTPTSPYPFNCLVFVRNVHPETNKTTLKSLFNNAFEEESSLDYVDFTKGMDTCYIRLASSHHAMSLITYFGAQPKVQADGLDGTGRIPVGDDKVIAIELIQGKKEELYWDKVPEKVRRQAVDKAVNTERATVELSVSPTTPRNGAHGRGGEKRPREP